MSAVTVAGHGELLQRGRSAHQCDFGHGTTGGSVRLGETFLNHFSPSLHATSNPAQIISSSPTSMFLPSLSPYVVNHKRRDFPIPAAEKPRVNVIDVDLKEGGGLIVEKVEVEEDDSDIIFSHSEYASVIDQNDTEEGGNSSCSHVLGGDAACFNSIEYYDATEDFGSDSLSSQAFPPRSCTETDFRSARLNMFEEIERHESNVIGHVFEEFVIFRSISEAIDREVLQDEIETSIEAKNNEISRLNDRLRYYETVNREMSQRNQKTIAEIFRRKCEKKRRRQLWIWGSIGLSFAIGASLLAYYPFTPQPSEAEEQVRSVILNDNQ